MFDSIKKIHFIGIGGSGMSGIAEVLLTMGYTISGSDMKRSEVTDRLKKLGVRIFLSHKASHIGKSDVVVTSTAIKKNNVEVLQAEYKKIPVIPRAEMLAELIRLKYAVLVAGTHGKTTATSMTSWLLTSAGFEPTIVIGGRFNNIGTGAKLGVGRFIVAEADESDGSFLKLSPTIAMLTNIDNDHLDFYKNMDLLKKAFLQFVDKVPFYGWCVLCNDDANVRALIPHLNRKYITYGITRQSDVMAKNISVKKSFQCFDVFQKGKKLGTVKMRIPGMHNVLNALGSVAAALSLGVPFSVISSAFREFKGVGRRLEYKGEKKGVLVIDDYGHHPKEISATWKAAKHFWKDRKKIVVFQPHRYSRTKLLAKEFAKALSVMDKVVLLPIYPACEKPIKGVSHELIYRYIPKNKHKNIEVFQSERDALKYLLKNTKPGSVVLTLGAGDVVDLGEKFLGRL